MNRWITLRIQVLGTQVNYYADNGSGAQLLKTWPVPVTSPADAYYLTFSASSVCWKSGANDTSFRSIQASGTAASSGGLLVTSADANRIFRFDSTTGAFLQRFDNSSVTYSYGDALGPDGLLYTATTDATTGFNSHIDRFDPVTGTRVASFGALPQTRAMTIGPDGLIYVSAFNSDQVWRYSPYTGAFLDVFANIYRPHALAFGPDGNLYVVSPVAPGGNIVAKVNATTRAISTFVSDPGLDLGTGMVFGPDGSLYLGTSAGVFASQVRRYNGATGAFDRVFATVPNSDQATALAFGPDGKLYVGTGFAGSVLRYDGTSGTFLDVFIPGGTGGLGTNITGLLFLSSAPTGGTVSVSTNLQSATFTITGPATYNGSGKSFSQSNAPAGTYSISFGDVACHQKPNLPSETLNSGGAIITFTGNYLGLGSLTVGVSPAAVTPVSLVISPTIPGFPSAISFPVTRTSIPVGHYKVTFQDRPGWITPTPIDVDVLPCGSLAIIGTYTPAPSSGWGTVSITTNDDAASFAIASVTDASYKPAPPQMGRTSGPFSVREGTYTVTFRPLSIPNQKLVPLPETLRVVAGQTTTFSGIYRRVLVVSFTGFGNAPVNFDAGICNTTGNFARCDTYPVVEWASPDRGATDILATLRGMNFPIGSLQTNAFTFFSSGPATRQLNGGPKTAPTDETIHVEAGDWLRGLKTAGLVGIEDRVIIMGHSYGGNRARLFAEQAAIILGRPVDLLAAIDPVDWTACRPSTAGFVDSHCYQRDRTVLPTSSARAQLSFYEIRGPGIAGYVLQGTSPRTAIYVEGFHAASVQWFTSISPDTAIANTSQVKNKIIAAIQTVVQGPVVNAVIKSGDVFASGGNTMIRSSLAVTPMEPITGLKITSATLGSTNASDLGVIGAPTSPPPLSLGDLVPDGTSDIRLIFPFVGSSGTSTFLTITAEDSFGRSVRVPRIRVTLP